MKLKELRKSVIQNFSDSRKEFVESWLGEMPAFAGALDTFPNLLITINDFLNHGIEKVHLSGNLFKLSSGSIMHYWLEHENKPVLIIEVQVKPEVCQINMVGKSSNQFGKPPYASELYEAILKDSGKSLLISDEYLTDSSFDVWLRLLKDGKKISVYDVKTTDMVKIDNEEQLKSYYHPAANRFRFTISESVLEECSIRASFRRYQFRKANNIL